MTSVDIKTERKKGLKCLSIWVSAYLYLFHVESLAMEGWAARLREVGRLSCGGWVTWLGDTWESEMVAHLLGTTVLWVRIHIS